MKKFAVILLVLSLTRIGVAYADSTNSSDSQNYFFGTKSAAENLNQVLALLVGPKGEPGPAGVAGKDGLIGMDGKDGVDGKDGRDGLDGAPGAVGVAGSSVLSVAFTGAQGNCTAGGVRFTDGAGNVTYTCNGAPGANGLNGINGTNGTNGTNGINGGSGNGGSITYGQGVIAVGACDTDGVVAMDVQRKFNGFDFVFSQFSFGDSAVTDGDVDAACSGLAMSVYITISNSVTKDYQRKYQPGDVIVCTKTYSTNPWPTSNPQFTFSDSLTPNICKISSRDSAVTSYFAGRGETPVRLVNGIVNIEDISTADYTDRVGFSIG